MVATEVRKGSETAATSTPVIVFSSDSHIGPRAVDLRPYCPASHLERFDEWVAGGRRNFTRGQYEHEIPGGVRRVELNAKTDGHHDMHQRLRDMDGDGIAASVIFFGSQNGEPFPFATQVGFGAVADTDRELRAVGMRIYNRWLADVCSIEPARHIGCAHLPSWDIDLTVAEIEWAREAGLRGLNWPAPRAGGIEFDDPAWEPCWSAAESLGMTLNTHVGAPVPGVVGRDDAVQNHAVVLYESGGWPSRRGIARMIFGGVFERHPDLKLIMTEQPGVWWQYTCGELDSIWMHKGGKSLLEIVPKKPSEYFRTNVFVGASFLSRMEAEAAVEDGFTENIIWGSDYPHREGTWAYAEHDDEPNRTRLALRDALAGLPAGDVNLMVGENAVRVYDLDREELTKVADRIGAPTLDELETPLHGVELDEVARILDPALDYTHAFRSIGPWY